MAAKSVPTFDSRELLRLLSSHKTTREYRDKQGIFLQGDAADAMFYLQHGSVKLTSTSRHGKKAVVGILGPGDFFGEGCMSQKSLRKSTATSIHQSTIFRMGRSDVARTIRREPEAAKLFITYLLSRVVRMEDDFVDQIFNFSERRLARVLLLLAGFGKHSRPQPAILKVNQGTLAEMIGTTRSRVSCFMNRFRKMGFIHYRNGRDSGLQVHRALYTFLNQ